jgi:hypothetical protein
MCTCTRTHHKLEAASRRYANALNQGEACDRMAALAEFFRFQCGNAVMTSRFDPVGDASASTWNLNSPLARFSVMDSEDVPRFRTGGSAQGEVDRTDAWRRERVAVAAYYLAEKRGFEPGYEVNDWARAELQTNAIDAAGS